VILDSQLPHVSRSTFNAHEPGLVHGNGQRSQTFLR
jgi:hypothetical protein